jgi:F-type H+-transporting ATPase subunit gamma
MKIVASTKLTRAQKAMNESITYGKTSQKTFEEAGTVPAEGEGKKSLLVICSSDKGLCGGIHSGLSRYVRKQLTTDGLPSDIDIAVIGEKCKAQMSRSNPKNMVLSFSGVGKAVPTFADATSIADQLCLLNTQYDSIKILYNKFINATSYEPTIIEAFSEEAIKESGMSTLETVYFYAATKLTSHFQPTSLPSRSTRLSSPASASTLLPTPSSGLLPRVTLASSPPAATPWTTPPRTPVR